MQYRNDKNGQPISVLGYGCMRFTKNGRNIDFDKAEKELMKAYELGVNYFDTAYIYTGSEALLGEVFEKNQIRDKINIATKLPQYMIKDRSGLDKYFNEELSRLRTSYVDYYLMHHLTDLPMWEKLKEADKALRPLHYRLAIHFVRAFMYRKPRRARKKIRGRRR